MFMSKFTLKTRIMLSNFLRNKFKYRKIGERISKSISSISTEFSEIETLNNESGIIGNHAAIQRQECCEKIKIIIALARKGVSEDEILKILNI
jgi:F0F1-type ATP synthase membrane subunit b/b'